MKKIVTTTAGICISALSLFSCKDDTYEKTKKFIDNIVVIDTHEHQKNYTDFNFYEYRLSYFDSDVMSAGAPMDFSTAIKETNNPDTLWALFGKYIEYGRTTSYYYQLMKGFQKCYGFDNRDISKDYISELSQKASPKNKNYQPWFDEAFHIGNFQIMFLDQYWNQYNINIDTSHFALVFRVDSVVQAISDAAMNKQILGVSIKNLLNKDLIITNTIDDYVAVMDSVFKIFVSHQAVCLKNALAYGRTLDFADVSYEIAKGLFLKKTALSELEKRQLEDFMFHWCIKKAIEYQLPIQIHTGYLAGIGGQLDHGHPMKLLPLFKKYPKAKFILFHGGYPWTSEYVALGKEFSNVYLDLVWLPQISRTVAIRTLHELLDCVPYNKIGWGGDVTDIEGAVGALEVAKEIVALVLTERIKTRVLSEAVAKDIALKIFRENAIEIYNLDNILNQ